MTVLDSAGIDTGSADPAGGAGASPAPVDAGQIHEPGAQEPAAQEPDWRARMAGDDPDLRKQLDRFADESALAKSWQHAQKTISSGKRLDAPQPDWGAEQWDSFYDKLGRPKDPKEYKVDLKIPEGVSLPDETKAVLTDVTQTGHRLGFTQAQMQGVHEFVASMAVQQLQDLEKSIVDQRAASEAQLKQLWGQDYDTNVRYAQAAVNQLHRETGVDWRGLADVVTLDGAKLGDRPEFVRLMAAAGRALGADPLLDVRSEGVAQSVEGRKAALMALRATDPKKYNSPEVQGELDQLLAALQRR